MEKSIKKKRTKVMYRWISQIFNPILMKNGLKNYIWYLKDLKKYAKMEGAENIEFINTQPCISW
ncbi:MAG: hypothetical protein JXA99_04085 [Candidatus Lokiarchaeota archaeon]|nr:hypothetical protein [Candidatus Lokiarchaeota archaeon]